MEDLAPRHSPFLDQYIPLVEFLGQSMGPNVEIVLHDLDVPDQSIVAIANAHISGRKIGGPVTDFALWFMKQGDANHVPMMTGYRAVNAEGRVCRSSSYFLRDENNVMRGMLCINVDVSDLIQIKNLATKLMSATDVTGPEKTQAFGGYPGSASAPAATPAPTGAGATAPAVAAASAAIPAPDALPDNVTSLLKGATAATNATVPTPPASTPVVPAPEIEGEEENEEVVESLRANVQNLLDSMLEKAISHRGIPPERMQRCERVEVVRDLEDAGFFLLKGGISAAAKHLDVSEPTIYRYLVEVRD